MDSRYMSGLAASLSLGPTRFVWSSPKRISDQMKTSVKASVKDPPPYSPSRRRRRPAKAGPRHTEATAPKPPRSCCCAEGFSEALASSSSYSPE